MARRGKKSKPVAGKFPPVEDPSKTTRFGACQCDRVLAYLASIKVDGLTGLHEATAAKMGELGLNGDVSVPPAPSRTREVDGREVTGSEPTGNMRGIMNWVGSLTSESPTEKKHDLQVIHATISQRRTMAGIT